MCRYWLAPTGAGPDLRRCRDGTLGPRSGPIPSSRTGGFRSTPANPVVTRLGRHGGGERPRSTPLICKAAERGSKGPGRCRRYDGTVLGQIALPRLMSGLRLQTAGGLGHGPRSVQLVPSETIGVSEVRTVELQCRDSPYSACSWGAKSLSSSQEGGAGNEVRRT